LHGLLMVALYRCRRRADALAAYRRLCTNLQNELGAEPAATLRRLNLAIRAQDSQLDTQSARALV
jgi:DNA-binding SARP family transcriptional activator